MSWVQNVQSPSCEYRVLSNNSSLRSAKKKACGTKAQTPCLEKLPGKACILETVIEDPYLRLYALCACQFWKLPHADTYYLGAVYTTPYLGIAVASVSV